MLQEHDAGVNQAGIAWISAATRDPRDTRYTWLTNPGARRAADTGRLFDAVVLRADLGAAVLELLTAAAEPTGAVIAEGHAGKWAYLVGPGSADAWLHAVGPPAGTRYHYVGHGGCLTLPGPRPHPGSSMTWIVRPGLGTNLTCVTSLAGSFLAAEARRPRHCAPEARWPCPACRLRPVP
ncbi:hypothetical protein [Embleya sp. NBC_00896]|uniref:hypothetical protein n=1 Tax=Embleya sp. NBC_00896 TaxID=2975961 RepID=UPI00386A39DB|nr:hypothetical protein OG928_26755 [Embleya sp. NBC_00896]